MYYTIIYFGELNAFGHILTYNIVTVHNKIALGSQKVFFANNRSRVPAYNIVYFCVYTLNTHTHTQYIYIE